MGACLYDPPVGTFLEVDPIEGGSCNDYDYVCGDPVNGFDLGGTQLAKESQCRAVFDFVHRVCTVEEIKDAIRAADERARRARESADRMNAKEARSSYVKPPLQPWEPRNNPIGDAVGWTARRCVSGVTKGLGAGALAGGLRAARAGASIARGAVSGVAAPEAFAAACAFG